MKPSRSASLALAAYGILVALSAAWALTRPRPHPYSVPVFCDLPVPMKGNQVPDRWKNTVTHPGLPKAPLLKIRWHGFWFRSIWDRAMGRPPLWNWWPLCWLYTRCANAATLSIGPIHLLWRRSWLEGPAHIYHPELFT